MAEIVVRVPEDLKAQMERAPGVDWSKVARDAIRERASKLAQLKAVASRSRLTEKDAMELGKVVSRGLHGRYRKLYPGLK